MNTNRKYDLEARLIKFTVAVHLLAKKMPPDYGARILIEQLIRSATSPALTYGEAQSAESDKDFVPKMRLCLKELRESQINLKVIKSVPYLQDAVVDELLAESGELVAIFTKSIETKRNNMRKNKM